MKRIFLPIQNIFLFGGTYFARVSTHVFPSSGDISLTSQKAFSPVDTTFFSSGNMFPNSGNTFVYLKNIFFPVVEIYFLSVETHIFASKKYFCE